MKTTMGSGPPDQFPKSCACGRVHNADAWSALPNGYVQTFDWGLELESRQCPCGSHISIVLAEGEPGPEQAEPMICACKRCGRIEELRDWRGLRVCLVCEYALIAWAEQQETYARRIVAQNERFRALRSVA